MLFLESEVLLDSDLNGDGDTEDPILSVWDSRLDEVRLTEWSSTGTIDTEGLTALIATQEESADRDLNGDGDAEDSVLSFLELETGRIREVGFAFTQAKFASETRAVILVDEAMEGKEYLIGDFSAADTMLGHACVMSNRLGCVTDEMKNLKAYVGRIEKRPAFQKAMSVG